MSENDPLFLDTSIQIQRHFQTKDRKRELAAAISGRKLFCSSYAYREFLQTVVDGAIALHNMIRMLGDVSDAMIKLQIKTGPKYKQLSLIYHSYHPNLGDDVDLWLQTLSELIEWQFGELFRLDLVDLFDGTGCEIARREPVKLANGCWDLRVTCTKTPRPDCGMESFIKDRKDALPCVVKCLRSLPKLDDEMAAMAAIAEKVAAQQDLPLGRNCYQLGDAVILMETPDDAKAATINDRHFSVLSPALNKRWVHI